MAERAVLTTGANSGIGLSTVIELARRGFRSYGSVRSEAKAEAVARAAADAGVQVHTVLMDVTDAERCEQVMSTLRLYGLVNNAGYGMIGAVEDVDDDEARQMLEAMVIAPMRLARLALPAMREQGGGRIVNVSSIAGLTTSPFAGWYTAVKHALEAVSDALRMEVARDGVKVVLVEPGGFRTDIWDDFEKDLARRAESGSRFMDAYRRSMQATRMAEPLMGNPQMCARIIARAMSSPNPRARYLVGMDAQMINLAEQLTPTAVKDRVSRFALGI